MERTRLTRRYAANFVLTVVQLPPPTTQVDGRLGPRGELEGEPRLQQAAGDDTGRLFRINSVSVGRKRVPISNIQRVAGSPNGCPTRPQRSP